MAKIERHPDVADYIVEMTLPEIEARRGIADLFENGQMVILKDYRLAFDFEAIGRLTKSTDRVLDGKIRKALKKLQAPVFFQGEAPIVKGGRLLFADPVRQAVFDVLCNGDRVIFDRASHALESAHGEILRIFGICFPDYESFRFIPSLRLTRTLFENLHWDNHSIDDDFHQARIFVNLDTRPRIWHISHRFIDYMRGVYREHDLGRFAGKDPNLMLSYINGDVLGGTTKTWMEALPKHRIAFDSGELWLGESRMISHQIFYGESAMVYMWFVKAASMSNADNRFNARIENLHELMAAEDREVVSVS
ncbi:hypothetical protein KFK14_15015 [Sphingobium phenoxybenzoativorans]|uniref:Uncharacterized protein n=1 Tax=Sphingobium phenoxybenzoativorans TaxID=1592790 RepID=A0A975K6G9_9SPHN|nr:hypothetical protein [Sphingobium phenoxybenzoativorans]QUT04372.1 hypothetical protein KFK14_15015 [Sphingobium phenoxybenzoativorans]